MICYIKDMKTFETLSKFDTTEYSLAEGENGQVTIYQKNAVELTTKYVGMWLIINKELFYIDGATPNDDSIDLVIQEPIYAFSRQVEYDGSTSYGDLIKNILDDNFGINCSDSEYKLSYLTVSNTDSTPCEIETDDYGFVIPYEVFDAALYEGVDISFNFTNTELLVSISTANRETGVVVFNDGSTTLESESYDANYIAKVTVIHDLPTPEPEPDPTLEESEEDPDPALEEDPDPGRVFEVIDYYLSTDGHISTTPPVNRAKGIWKYYNASQDENPLSVAIGAFSHNNDNHKIEFRSLTRFALYQPIKMRLRQEVFTTIITARILSSDDNRYYYKCGNLATTLTEKIESETGETSSEVKALKKRVSYVSNQIEHFDIDFVYPVGSIYMSVNDTNPATLFGGTWEQLQNRFLLGAGSSYAAGSTGGEATHVLNINEMPSHTHGVKGWRYGHNQKYDNYSLSYTQLSDAASSSTPVLATGGGAAHNNMPPYLVVYIWKRTA